MLSDERIRQIAEDIYCSEGTRAEIEHSIRAALAEAAQSVPVVERNQCDGCNRGLQVCDDGLHREPSGHPVMACTRNKYTHSIPAAELATLREKAAEADELRKDAERPDCGTCANRGRVDGLSQETFCEHCSWSEKWRKNHYKPTATQERQS